MYIHTQTKQVVSEQEIRNAYPNTSFSVPFNAPNEYAWVFSVPQPTITDLQVAREIAPTLTSKGNYEEQWEVLDKFQDYTDDAGVLHTKAEQEGGYLESQRKASIPQVVTIRQAKLALHSTGLLDTVNQVIAAAAKSIQIEWEYATEVKRDWPTLLAMQSALGLTSTQIDDLFKLAVTL